MEGRRQTDIPRTGTPELGETGQKPKRIKYLAEKVALPTGIEPVFSP